LNDAKLKASDISKIILVGGPTRMPIIQKFVEDYVGKKVERGVDPMECVAIGAGVQAAVLTGEVKDVLLLDVIPLSLGIETMGGVMTKLIERNTTIPVKKSQIFSTASDNQPAVTVHVLQGERPMSGDNTSLGRFDLVGIPPAPRGMPQIEVTFDIDANGILHVVAKDLGTGKEQKIRIESSSGLSKEEVERMTKDAAAHADEDKKKREQIEARNRLDSLIYATEKSMKEVGDKVSEDDRKKVEEALTKAKGVLDSDDAAAVKKAEEDLMQASHKLAEEMYKKSAGKPGAEQAGAGAGAAKSEEPVDAEYKVDEDK
jgi:molecular chaperone DnaK